MHKRKHENENPMEDEASSSSGSGDISEVETLTFEEHKENGNRSYKAKDYREAIAHYTLAIDQGKTELQGEGAETAERDAGTNDAATAKMDKTKLAAAYSNRAAAYQMLLMYDKALGDCDAAIQADSKFIKVHWRKAKVLTYLGRLDQAIKAYCMGLLHDPNDSKALAEKEDVKRLQQRYELAESLLVKNNNAADNVAVSTKKRNARQALAQIDIVLAQSPNWYNAQLIQVQAKVQLGGQQNIDTAYATTTKLLRRSDSGGSATLLYARAECLFYQGAMDDAMKHLKQILSHDPDNKVAFKFVKMIRNLKKQKEAADTKYKAHNYQEAIPLYGEAIDTCPEANESYRSKLYFNRAACHNALRQHAECVADCSLALKINPDYTKALLRRAASNLLIGGKHECQSALNDYEAVLKATSDEEMASDLQEKISAAKIQLKRASRRDLYKLLGVTRDATEAEIKKAYRKSALKWHPDRQSNATEEEKEAAAAHFREVNLAHEILSDATKRKRYDSGVDEQDIDDPHARPGGSGHSHGHGGFGGMDQEMLFEMFMRQHQHRGGGRRPGGFG